jgi:hypothetical protein
MLATTERLTARSVTGELSLAYWAAEHGRSVSGNWASGEGVDICGR